MLFASEKNMCNLPLNLEYVEIMCMLYVGGSRNKNIQHDKKYDI